MRAFARLRAQRRLSGFVVFALLILGALSAGHHHRLVVQPDAAGISAPSAFDPMARANECVVCRAADPARIVLVDIAAPQVDITSFVVPTATEHAIPAAFRPCSPRAPPVVIA